MKLNSKTKFGAMCVVLTLAHTQVSALSLGPMRGGAVLGKVLDVSVLVQFSAGEDVAATCFAADVAFGDNLLGSSQVTVQSQPGPQANTQRVRITTDARIDEAVVSVNLVTSCSPKASRRYSLLAELVSEPDSGAALVGASVALSAPTAPAAVVSAQAPAPGSIRVGGALGAAPRVPATTPARKRETPKPSALVNAERSAAVRAAKELNAAALQDLQRRVDEIAQWQTTSNTAEELLKSQAREKVLESDIQRLQAVTAKNQQSIQTVATALEESESRNYSNFLVYALGAILAVCLGAVAYVYARTRRGGSDASPWWLGGEGRIAPIHPVRESVAALPVPGRAQESPVKPEVKVSAPVSVAKASMPVVAAPIQKPVLDDLAGDSGWEPASAATSPVPVAVKSPDEAVPELVPTASASSKAISTKEMLDVRQQAEFFMALGQHDDAVSLLVKSIQSSDQANPLVYLDLLKILHTLSRRTDFERFRADFNQQFTGRIPEYASFLMEGNGLEVYDDICQQIVVLWPTDYTVDFIEQCLIRLPEDDPEQGIDLEAFKDLLLLYGMLKRLSQTQDSAVVPFSATRHANSQMMPAAAPSASLVQVDLNSAVPLPTIPASGAAAPITSNDLDVTLDLDLDLDIEVPAQAQPPAAAPDNLINFDMSSFVRPVEPKPPQK